MKQRATSALLVALLSYNNYIPSTQALTPSIRSNSRTAFNSNSFRVRQDHILPSKVTSSTTTTTTTTTATRTRQKDATIPKMMLSGMEGDIMSSVSDAFHSSGMLLSHQHEVDYDGPLAFLLKSPTVWSCAVMLSIVGLLLSWEEAIKTTRKKLPPALQPVIDSMLGEMGGIGFIGLFLSIFVTEGALGEVVEELSEKFLGEGEILFETFEFLHTSFFEVGIGFFTISGLIVAAVLRRIEKLEEVSLLAIDTDGDGVVTLEELADALDAECMLVDLDGDGVIDEEEITIALQKAQQTATADELTMGDKERGAECLVLRERLLLKCQQPENFVVETYFEQIFAHNLEEIVELSPVTWLPLIPIFAIDNSVDISHGVVSAASHNAADTCGLWFSNPFVLGSNVVLQVVCFVWGAYNFWKMAHIKSMLLPTLLRDGGPNGPARLLPPRVEDKKLRRLFRSTPFFFQPLENYFRKAPKNEHERLFGTVGANGPEFFRNSIKNHVWLCVAQIVFYGGQIVARDIGALITGVPVGGLADLVPETMIYGFFVMLSMAQIGLAPTTFLNYCVVTSVEQMTKGWAMDKAIVSNECLLDPSWLNQNNALPVPKMGQLSSEASKMDGIEVVGDTSSSSSSPSSSKPAMATEVTMEEVKVEDLTMAAEETVEELVTEIEEETEELVKAKETKVEEPVMSTEEKIKEPAMIEEKKIEETLIATEAEIEEPVMVTEAKVEEAVMTTETKVEEPVMATEAKVEEPVMATEAKVEEPVMATEAKVEEPVMATETKVQKPAAERAKRKPTSDGKDTKKKFENLNWYF